MKKPWSRKKDSALGAATGKLAKASRVYSENTVLRAAVNLVPWVGSSLDVMISSKGQSIVRERTMRFLEELKTEMSRLEKRAVNKDYLDSEEWFDLVMRALDAAARTRDHEKIKLYARVLSGAVASPTMADSSPEDYLAVLSELTPREIHVARALYAQQNDRPLENESELQWAQRKGWDKLSEQSQVPTSELQFVLLRLQRAGLAKEITGTYYDYAGGVYVVTESFRGLMKFLGEQPHTQTTS